MRGHLFVSVRPMTHMMNIKHHQHPVEPAQGLQVKMRDVFDVVRDLDKTGPDGSAQTNQTAVEAYVCVMV